MDNILVVGGAGYIGSHCCKLLKNYGKSVIVLDNFSTGHREFVKYGTLYEGNLGDKALLNKIFSKNTISAVMHFAAFASVGESVSNPQKYYRNNLLETINLLDSMIEHQVKRFIFSSTCASYGNPQTDTLSESHPQDPINPYGWSKFMIEKILADYDLAYGMKSIIFRYFNAAGADPDAEIGEWHEPETHLIPLVLDVASAKRNHIAIYGNDYPTKDGTCIRDYIHVNDLSEAHILGYEYLINHNKSEIFNLGNEQGFSVKEIISISEKICGKKISFIFSERRSGDPPKLVADASKAKQVLKWTPKFNRIETIIESAWNYHRTKI